MQQRCTAQQCTCCAVFARRCQCIFPVRPTCSSIPVHERSIATRHNSLCALANPHRWQPIPKPIPSAVPCGARVPSLMHACRHTLYPSTCVLRHVVSTLCAVLSQVQISHRLNQIMHSSKGPLDACRNVCVFFVCKKGCAQTSWSACASSSLVRSVYPNGAAPYTQRTQQLQTPLLFSLSLQAMPCRSKGGRCTPTPRCCATPTNRPDKHGRCPRTYPHARAHRVAHTNPNHHPTRYRYSSACAPSRPRASCRRSARQRDAQRAACFAAALTRCAATRPA